jgi:hypothetical protein
MLLQRCRSIHTFGMRQTISVAFLDRTMRVIEARRCRPGRIVNARRSDALHTLECAVRWQPRIGDRFTRAVRAGR